MAQYSNLKAYIEEKIYENGTQAITGDILQDVLKVMTDDLGEFYQTGGVASPSTDPGTPDAKVIYIATEAGSYTNFGGIELAAGEVALLVFDTTWTKVELNVLSAANGGVKTANLADGAVTTAKIANGAVGEGKIADASVTSGKLGSGAVTTEKIADGAATTDKIADKAVATGKLGDKAVTSGKIADKAVGTGQVADEAITEGKIADAAVTSDKIAENAVTTAKIDNGAVIESKIQNDAVKTAKIGSKAVTTAKIADKAVTSGQLGDKAVTTDKIADGAVGSDQLAEGAFSAQNLADGSVTTNKLADDAVTAEKIADGAVTAGKFADGSVSAAKLASGAVITEKIGDGMVTRQKLADSSVGTSKIIDGAVTTAKVADANVTTAKIADANVTTGKLADGAVTTAKIADGDVTGAKLQEGVRPVINVNALNEQTTAYGSAALARAAVPSALRILGLHVIYLLAGGWFEDEFIGSDVSGWGTASNWRAVGPVSVSQNTETGGYDLTIGSDEPVNIAPQDNYGLVRNFPPSDYAVSDEQGNVIFQCKNGGIKTNKFDSEKTDNRLSKEIEERTEEAAIRPFTENDITSDLLFCDEHGNAIGGWRNGKMVSKYPAPYEEEGQSTDLDISDISKNTIFRLKDGHIRTKNFNSKILKEQVDSAVKSIDEISLLYKNKFKDKTIAVMGDSIMQFMSSVRYGAQNYYFKDTNNNHYDIVEVLVVSGVPFVASTLDSSVVIGATEVTLVPGDPNRYYNSEHLEYSYTKDLVTKINDTYYLTSTLVDGQVVPTSLVVLPIWDYEDSSENVYEEPLVVKYGNSYYLRSTISPVKSHILVSSVRVDVVNPSQDIIDNQDWDSLKNKLGAKRIVNLGIGSSGVTVKHNGNGFVTSYPCAAYAWNPAPTYEYRGLPNMIKWMQRLISENKMDVPDIVVIWIGVNGAGNVIDGTLDTAMQIPYETLADDIDGWNARNTYFGALRYAIETIWRNFEYCSIFLVSPIQTKYTDHSGVGTPDSYRGYTNLAKVRDAFKQIADRYSVHFEDAFSEIGISNFAWKADGNTASDITASGDNCGPLIVDFLDAPPAGDDGVHPNEKGKVIWTNYLVNALKRDYFERR